MLCTNNGIPAGIQHEQERNEDLVFMECEEGYLNGTLTRKIASAMRYYLQPSQHAFDLFMKIDDDTYMSRSRLCDFIEEKKEKPGVAMRHNVYMGVFSEGYEKMKKQHEVIRDPENPWFEPWEKFPYDTYPLSAKGGPGYILSRPLVTEIIDRGISENFELNNEDKAVGYWVKKLRRRDLVHYLNIPGTDGYAEHSKTIVNTGSFKDYPYTLHHHLDGHSIACLHKVEIESPEGTIDHCLSKTSSLWSTRRPPVSPVRIHMPY